MTRAERIAAFRAGGVCEECANDGATKAAHWMTCRQIMIWMILDGHVTKLDESEQLPAETKNMEIP